MRKLVLVLLVFCIGCQSELIYNQSEYNCGKVIGGDDTDGVYRLKVSYPDGEYWSLVTKKAYEYYGMFDDICFDTIVWE